MDIQKKRRISELKLSRSNNKKKVFVLFGFLLYDILRKTYTLLKTRKNSNFFCILPLLIIIIIIIIFEKSEKIDKTKLKKSENPKYV